MYKKKILWVGEASFLNTGYSVISLELLSRLNNEYEIAELASYGEVNDMRRLSLPWTYYGNMPCSEKEMEQYAANNANQWGVWRFDEVLLDFKPDVVLSCRDPWVDKFIAYSQLRKYFKWVYMPTIDSIPQSPQMISIINRADAVLAYSEFGKNEILRISDNKFAGIAMPSANREIMKPVANKEKHKINMGFKPGVKIIGTVMRNQRRKLFPDLIKSFEKFCLSNLELSKDIYLYLHTDIYDIGWDIARIIRESKIGHKVLFTYICKSCGCCFPSFFHGQTQMCIECGSFSAGTPGTDVGATTEQLADIINCFDLYVQYSIAEGLGVPIIEAAMCGVPIMAVDYSAMSSHIKYMNVIPIKVARFFTEPETHFTRAYPDNDDFVSKLVSFFRKTKQEQVTIGKKTYLSCMKYCSWEKAANTWKQAIEHVGNGNWNHDFIEYGIPNDIPFHLHNYDFVMWCVDNILREPELKNDYHILRMVRDLNIGKIPISNTYMYNEHELREQSFVKFTKKQALQEFLNIYNNRMYLEKLRTGVTVEEQPEFIRKKKI